MKTFLEQLQEAQDTQSKINFIRDPNSSTRSIVNMATRGSDVIVKKEAQQELQRRRDNGDKEAAAAEPNQDPSMHSAASKVDGASSQYSEPVKKKGSLGKDILNRLAKGKTISGDTPNQIKLNPEYILRSDGLKEEAMKTVVFSFGRMNPPTIGHEKLVNRIVSVAKANRADARLFLSRTEGNSKNPLPYSEKIKLAKTAFPGVVQDTPADIYPAGFIGLLKILEDKYDKVIIVVGSDRLPNIKALANKYNGSEYKFKEIEVVSAGERDPDEEGVGGMSASKMRAAAAEGDLAAFKSGLPSRLKSVAKMVMDKLQKYLSEELDEAVLTTAQRLKRRAQMRRSKGKIRMGQKRAIRRKANAKQISKRSRRIAVRMMRKRILRGRNYNDISLSARQAVDRQIARRKTAIARIAKRIEPKLRRAEAARKSGAGYASISLSSKKKLREGLTRDNLITTVNSIMKHIIEEQNYSVTPLELASLVKKSNETGIPVKIIKEVYARGLASWNMGLRENTTPQQWGFARVNSFLAGGYNVYTADKDLFEAKDPAQIKQELLQKISDPNYPLRSLWNHTRNSDQEVAKAARDAIQDRAKSGDQDAAKAVDSLQTQQGAQPAQQGAQPLSIPDYTQTPKFSASTAKLLIKNIPSGVEPKQQDDEESNLFAQHAAGSITDDELHQSIADSKLKRKEKEPEFLKEPEEPAIRKASRLAKEYKDLTSERKKLKKSEPAKQRAKQIDQRLKEISIEHRSLGISGKLTNESYAQTREKYDRQSAPTVSSDHTEAWNETRRLIDAETQKNMRSSNPEKVPGNASSAMNEAVSGMGAAQIITEKLDLNSKKSRARMAVFAAKVVIDEKGKVVPGSYLDQTGVADKSKPVSLPDGVSKTDLKNFRDSMINGPRIKPNIDNEKIVSQLDEKQILALYTATNMMHAKARVIQNAVDRLGWKDDELSSVSYTGSKSQLDAVVENLTRIKQEQIDTGIKTPYVVNQFGEKVDIDKAIELAETTGGGENPSDTTILTRNDNTGEVMFLQTSDKSNPKDQLGNTTVSAQFDDYELTLRAKLKAGQISQDQLDKALDALTESRKQVKTSESMIANERYAYSSNLLDMVKTQQGGAVELMDKLKTLSGSKGDTKYIDAFLKHPEAKGNYDYEKIQNVLEYMNKAVSSGDEEALSTFNSNHQEAMKRLADISRWRGSKAKPEPPSLEESNRHVSTIVTSQNSLSKQLDEISPNLGRDCVAYELMHRGHLTQHLKGALGADGDPATHGCFSLILGDYSPTSEMYQKAMGVDNIKDFLNGFDTTPVELTSSKEGKATGGSSLFIAQRHNVDDVEIGTTSYDDDRENAAVSKAISSIYKQYTRTRGGTNWGASMMHSDEILRQFREEAGYPAFSSKFKGELTEKFYDFLSYINESKQIVSVGNQPTVSAKPIHHKASGHEYHIHHMINPDIALKHQVKHATKRFDRDVDADIDQFDKPKSNFPDEVPVPTKGSTAKFFAKYKKEREHIHAGEPIDEQTETPQYTGDENSWYLDAAGQKVVVYSQSDLKHPEDVEKFLKNPTQEKDIGPIMSMKDFLKTQPEKKK